MYLHTRKDLQGSTFLHRLQVIGVPFGTLKRSGRGDINVKTLGQDQTVSYDKLEFTHLQSMVEQWEVQRTPHTDIRLIELSIEGDRLRDVCTRVLRREVQAAPDISALTRTLLRAVLANIPELYPRILRRCDEAVAGGSDLSALATAGLHLHQLAQQGSTRNFDASLVKSLLARIYTRAALLLPIATIVGDDEAAKVKEALQNLHKLSQSRKDLDAALLDERLALVADVEGKTESLQDSTVHPLLAGLAVSILHQRRAISIDDLSALLGRRLSGAEEPQKGAQFIEGLLSLNPRTILLQDRSIVDRINDYLQSFNSEAFLHVLPVLRRAMSELSKNEIGILLTTLAGVLGLKEAVQEVRGLEDAHIQELRTIEATLSLLLMEE
jgi:hypothetical protein